MAEPQLVTLAYIDDEFVCRRVAAKIAGTMGLGFLEGRDGDDAIAIRFGEPEPVAMLLNIMMPHRDGIEALKVIRERERLEGLPRLPIAFASGLGNLAQLAREHGADGYLDYPYEGEEMVAVVEHLLALARERQR